MLKSRVVSWIILTACVMIIIAHAPSIVLDPLKTALLQVRSGNVPTLAVPTANGSDQEPDVVVSTKAIKKQ